MINKLKAMLGVAPRDDDDEPITGTRHYKIYAAEERDMGRTPLSAQAWAKQYK